MQHARPTEGRQEEREEERDKGKGRATQASILIVRLVKSRPSVNEHLGESQPSIQREAMDVQAQELTPGPPLAEDAVPTTDIPSGKIKSL
ncbi:unnamed protein product [Sphagnum tenellum]